jgi:hypothetical protein
MSFVSPTRMCILHCKSVVSGLVVDTLTLQGPIDLQLAFRAHRRKDYVNDRNYGVLRAASEMCNQFDRMGGIVMVV